MNSTCFGRFVSVAPLVLTIACAISTPLAACATIASVPAPIYVEAESAVIIWDAQHHIEHFIRQAKIDTGSPDLGFLVPTPEAPTLVEADPRIFTLASNIGAPVTSAPQVTETPWQIIAPLAANPVNQIQTELEGGTTVLGTASTPANQGNEAGAVAEQDVAGYHVTILDPADTAAVNGWLTRNGYKATPYLTAWLKAYGDAGWKINAFRLTKPASSGDSITTRAIRLTFHTDQPYYPYSEPADRQNKSAASPGGRILRVAVLSDHRMAAKKDDDSTWPGRLMFAGSSAGTNQLSDANEWRHFAALTSNELNATDVSELTTFVDRSNPRLGTADLYFSNSPDASNYRAEITDSSLPVVRKIDWSNPVADAAALLAIVVIPGVPLSCGWLLFARRRAYLKGGGQLESPTLRTRLSGFASIIWCSIYGMILTYHLVIWLVGAGNPVLAPNQPTPIWLSSLLFSVPVVAMAAAVVLGVGYCGVQVWRSREIARASRFQETLAIAAMLVGAVGLSFMLYMILRGPV
jgi:hypothetical protein